MAGEHSGERINELYPRGQKPAPNPMPPEQQDPMALIYSILGQTPPDFDTLANQQASSIYGPIYQANQSAQQAARSQTARDSAELAAMYRALQNDISGQQRGIDANYNTTRTGVNQAYTQGQQAVQSAYRGANQDTANLLNKLGIQAAASDPRLLREQANQGAFLSSLLASNNQATQNMVSQKRQGSTDFNTAQRNIAGQEGTNKRADLTKLLSGKLGDLNNQLLSTRSQQAQTAAQLANQMQSGFMSQNQKLAEMAYQAYADQMKNQTELQKAQMSNQPNAYQQYQMSGPLSRAFSQAAQLFGSGSDNASNAVNLALSVGQKQSFNNVFQFIDAVKKANSANAAHNASLALPEDALSAVASSIWSELHPQTLPSYMNASGYSSM